VRPADYYSAPSPVGVLPRGITFGCAAAALVVLIIVFGGGVWMSSGGIVTFMDFALGMSMGEVRGFYTSDVTGAQQKELDDAMETLRANLRTGKVPVTALDPVLQTMRKGIADEKMHAAEVKALAEAARRASRPVSR
jgi:hypothetical protein